ncbi:PAS-domain containing protein [Jannaschia sp. KMU-145]|uniref:PAS-domain containing protein n=1 Tax=Jannaschia halovivens TaxID=3388667 RepID=UPI00396B237F
MSVALQMLLPALGGMIAGIGALGAVLWLAPRSVGRGKVALGSDAGDILSEPRQFRFRHGYLLDHSDNVGFLLPAPINHLKAWDELSDALADIAQGTQAAFDGLRDAGRPFRLEGRFGRDRIMVLGQRDGDDIRVTVSSADRDQAAVRIDVAALQAIESETALLTRASDASPALGWATDPDGRVIWANASYLALVDRCVGSDAARGWPIAALFPDDASAPPGTVRRKVVDRRGRDLWFEVTTGAPDAEGLRLVNGLSLDAVIQAEDSLRTFIQTLTKTFAHLPTGIAIFDRAGQLALFNPALMDMTGLDGTFLSRRPRLNEVFDALRDHQRLPEPRDYKAWRDALSDPARTDAGGTYTETWTLPSGVTYRVTGRPQADGAVSLLLEDVTADVSESRRARLDRDMLGDLIDSVDEALVVFDADGSRLAANMLARTDLGGGRGPALLPPTLEGCIDRWSGRCAPSPVWGEIRALPRLPGSERAAWAETLRQKDGTEMTIKVTPLSGDRLSLGFVESTPRISILPDAGALVRSVRA